MVNKSDSATGHVGDSLLNLNATETVDLYLSVLGGTASKIEAAAFAFSLLASAMSNAKDYWSSGERSKESAQRCIDEVADSYSRVKSFQHFLEKYPDFSEAMDNIRFALYLCKDNVDMTYFKESRGITPRKPKKTKKPTLSRIPALDS